jgi:hypothetical protein
MAGCWRDLGQLLRRSAGVLRIGDAALLAGWQPSHSNPYGMSKMSGLACLASSLASMPSLRTFSSSSWSRHSEESVSAKSGVVRYSESLEEIRSRIFGTHIGNGQRSGRKILRRKLIGSKIASYYPEDITKKDPFMPDLAAER